MPKDGNYYQSEASLTEEELTLARIALSDAEAAAQEYTEEVMNNWWWHGCNEIRVAEAPRKKALRPGESVPFKLEVYHYQDAAPAPLPIEAWASGRQPSGQNGQISPETSSESPASFTFTAPSRQESPRWESSSVAARSTSRRGRASGGEDAPVFTKLDETALYLVEVHGTVTTELDGVVFDVTYQGYVGSKKGDPTTLEFTSGSYSGSVRHVIRRYATCEVVKDEHRSVNGAVDLKGSGAGILPAMPPVSREPRFLVTFNGVDFDGGETLGLLSNAPGTPLDEHGDGQSTRTETRDWGQGCEGRPPNKSTVTVESRVIRIGR